MRVAVCVSGQMRTFKHVTGGEAVFQSMMDRVVRPYEADVFVHTWDETGYTIQLILAMPKGFSHLMPMSYWHGNSEVDSQETPLLQRELPNFYQKVQDLAVPDSRVEFDDLASIYGTRDIVIEKFDRGDFSRRFADLSQNHAAAYRAMGNSLPMLYKIHACDALRQKKEKEQGFKYDLVIRLRPDYHFAATPIFDPVEFKGRLATLYPFTYEQMKIENLSFDGFFVGDSDTMTYATNLWERMPEFLNPDSYPDWPLHERGPEASLFRHLSDRNLQGNVLRLRPMPTRMVPSVSFTDMVGALDADFSDGRQVPAFLDDCVPMCHSIEAVDLYEAGKHDTAYALLASALSIGGHEFPEPHVGRAKIAQLEGRPDEAKHHLALGMPREQWRAYPELLSIP